MLANFFSSSLSRFLVRSKQLSFHPRYYVATNSLKSELSRLYDKIDQEGSEGKVMDFQSTFTSLEFS